MKTIGNSETRSPTECHAAMTWAQRLKRVFKIEMEICGKCGGAAKVIVDASNLCIEEQEIIHKILAHLRKKEQSTPTLPLLLPRA